MGRLAPGKTMVSEIWMEIHRNQMNDTRWALVKQAENTVVRTGPGRSKSWVFVSFPANEDTVERMLEFRGIPKMTSEEVRLLMEERDERGEKDIGTGRGR